MKLFIYILIFIVAIQQGWSQDMNSSSLQFLTPIYNPSLTALNNDFEAGINFRNQWKKSGTPFKNYSAYINSTLQPNRRNRQSHLAVGLTFYQEQMGQYSSILSSYINTTYHLQFLKNSKLSVGLSLGIFSTNFDTRDGTWNNQHNGFYYDSNLSSGEQFLNNTRTNFDSGMGAIYSFRKRKKEKDLFQVGFSMFHLNPVKLSITAIGESKLPVRTVLFSKFNYDVGKSGVSIDFLGLYQNQGKFNTFTFGSSINVKLIEKAKTSSSITQLNQVSASFGLYVRSNDAVIFNFGIQKSKWNFSLAYDVTFSSFKSANKNQGAFEFQLNFKIPSYKIVSHY